MNNASLFTQPDACFKQSRTYPLESMSKISILSRYLNVSFYTSFVVYLYCVSCIASTGYQSTHVYSAEGVFVPDAYMEIRCTYPTTLL